MVLIYRSRETQKEYVRLSDQLLQLAVNEAIATYLMHIEKRFGPFTIGLL